MVFQIPYIGVATVTAYPAAAPAASDYHDYVRMT